MGSVNHLLDLEGEVGPYFAVRDMTSIVKKHLHRRSNAAGGGPDEKWSHLTLTSQAQAI
jgi:hypothetical protein